MTRHTVVGIRGDGIGPEIMDAALIVLEASGVEIDWVWEDAGEAALAAHGTPLPERVLESIRTHHVALKGPVTTPIGEGYRSVNVSLRKSLGLFAQVRPVKTIPGVPSRFSGVDIMVVRENSEGLYAGLEHEVSEGVVESMKVVTAGATHRIARFALDLARRHHRRKVTILHKANILKLSDGLFLRESRREASAQSSVEWEEMLVDAASMKLILNPQSFDVILADSFLGDIISEECAGLVGGAGLVPGYNAGNGIVVFEALHGSAPDIAGKGVANPTALILSSALLLRHLGEEKAAWGVEQAVYHVLAGGVSVTRDLGGTAGTAEFARGVAAQYLREKQAA